MTDKRIKKINKHLIKTRWLRIRYILVCLFRLSGKKDRNDWLRKNKIFSLYGENSNFQPHYLPSNPKLLKIHNNVSIAADVIFYEHDIINSVFARMDGDNDERWSGHHTCIEIFDNCFIGGRSILVGNLRIGPNAIVAAGSVVTKDVKPGEIVAGNPAKVVGNFFDLMEKRKKYDYDKPQKSLEEQTQDCWNNFYKIKNDTISSN